MRYKILFLFIFPVDISDVKGRVGVWVLFITFQKGEFAMWTKEDFVSRIKGICESRGVQYTMGTTARVLINPWGEDDQSINDVCATDDGLIWVHNGKDGNWTLEYDLSSQERSLIYKELWYEFDKANPQQWVGQ